MPTYNVWFAVRGHGKFPTDMMRYDACFPHSESDSWRIDDTEARGKRVVIMQRAAAPRKSWTPSPRWPSYGWEVLSVGSEAYEVIDAVRRLQEREAAAK